jgi:threonine dehydratase
MSAAVLPTFADVVAAAGRIEGIARRTPVMNSAAFDARVGRTVFFKCENLQHGGAFKFRGAVNALKQLDPLVSPIVATHSSGNHGTALALAARQLGFKAKVIMPRDSARPKFKAVETAGGEILLSEPGTAAREAALAELLAREPAAVVHPFDDERVIAGQGTAALELLTEVSALACIAAPVGGGGLIGGTALAARALAPGARVIAAEPASADDSARSFRSGVRTSAGVPNTIADGLRGSIGVRNFELLRRYVDDVVTVSESEIVNAMRVVLEDLKLLVEPSAAVTVAAIIAGRVGSPGERIGVVLSGGNVDLELCPFLAGKAPLP